MACKYLTSQRVGVLGQLHYYRGVALAWVWCAVSWDI
jgi:hypothetical protein